MTEFLNSIPNDFRPARHYPDLLAAAARLDSVSPNRAAQDAAVILQLLGTAAFYGVEAPKAKPQFPDDHAMHLWSGTEWYYLACNLTVQGAADAGRIGVFVNFVRNRAVSRKVQMKCRWSDEDAQVAYTLATITVDTPANKFVARRRSNAQWGINAPGGLQFSRPGEPFLVRCGSDMLQSPNAAILPLTVRVDDGTNLSFELTVTSSLPPERAFFYQGVEGLTASPDPGIYYSWPQVSVSGRVVANGHTYEVAGTGWIDHQLMMKNLAPPIIVPPAPSQLYQGWSWCGFNLSDGDAFTAAGFQLGDRIEPVLPIVEGFHVSRTADGWEPSRILIGGLDLSGFEPMMHGVSMPTAWTWKTIDMMPGWPKMDVRAQAWNKRCDFESNNLLVISETPVDLYAGFGGAFAGTGYCESLGYESIESFERRALAYLDPKSTIPPAAETGRLAAILRRMEIRRQ